MAVTVQDQLGHLSLFNLPAFSSLRGDGRLYQRVDVSSGGRFVGTLAGVIWDDEFVSGYGASFGGLDFVRERETLEVVTQVVEDAVQRVRDLGVDRMSVRAKPFHYSRNEEYLHFALLRSGFTATEVNLNFYLDLERLGSPDAYRAGLRHSPERQLRLALAADFVWREALAAEDWTAGYGVLAENRARHGAALSLSQAEVSAMREMFRERVRMFLLERGGVCVAAVLLYVINAAHAMVMYWGDLDAADVRTNGDRPPIAVMNLVAFRTIETAFSSGFRTIDLGPVSTRERVNFGNARFKASIDSLPNFRYTLTRTFQRSEA